MQTYDPTKVTLSILGNTITGYAPDSFVKVSRAEDGFMLTIGADGRGARTRNANKSGQIEITLLAASVSNDVLSALAVLDELTGQGVGPALIKDSSSLLSVAAAQNSWIKKIPDLERAKELGNVTWVIETDHIDIFNSGTIP